MTRKRDDSGQFESEITEERVLEALGSESDSVVVRSASQVADELGCSRQAADRKLRALADDGKVLKHDLGPRSVAWTLPRVRHARDDGP